MTDIKLLSLPNSGSGFYEDNVWHDTFSKRQMEAYARANVAHATAPLQAEIEALRASKGATYIKYELLHAELAKSKARAERMADALSLIAAPIRPDGTWNRDREACRQIACDVLIDHDQEDKNDE